MSQPAIDSLNPTFVRRLIVAHLIASQPRPSAPELIRLTGWPRRTLQDIIKALPGLGLEVVFVEDGKRHNDGYYQLRHWGPFDSNWVEDNATALLQQFDISLD